MTTCMYWPMSYNGSYSLKTGYQFLCKEFNRDSALTSSIEEKKKFWSGIWKLKVPGKVKTFIWKACHEALLTKVNLHKWKILTESKCSLCSKAPETSLHTLWEYGVL